MQTIYGQQLAPNGVQPRSFVPPAPVTGRTNGALPLHSRPGLAAVTTVRSLPAAKPGPAKAARAASVAAPAAGSSHAGRELIEALTNSKIYQDYERAFSEATGLPVGLRPVETWQLPLHGKRNEAPYCAMMSEKSRACASCLQLQERLSKAATQEAQVMLCPAGLSEMAVPVRLGDRLIGFLQTGQVFRHKPTEREFERTARMVEQWGLKMDRGQVREAYFATKVMPQKQQESAMGLLKVFAQHLAILSNQVMVQTQNAEPPAITKAKAYIQEHYGEDLSLGEVARAVCTSPFYFCKIFRKATGLHFTDYLSRVRIEIAKNLLLNPNLRISEIAYEVGFQSLTHFNRVFKRMLAQSPTDYRAQLLGHAA